MPIKQIEIYSQIQFYSKLQYLHCGEKLHLNPIIWYYEVNFKSMSVWRHFNQDLSTLIFKRFLTSKTEQGILELVIFVVVVLAKFF